MDSLRSGGWMTPGMTSLTPLAAEAGSWPGPEMAESQDTRMCLWGLGFLSSGYEGPRLSFQGEGWPSAWYFHGLVSEVTQLSSATCYWSGPPQRPVQVQEERIWSPHLTGGVASTRVCEMTDIVRTLGKYGLPPALPPRWNSSSFKQHFLPLKERGGGSSPFVVWIKDVGNGGRGWGGILNFTAGSFL